MTPDATRRRAIGQILLLAAGFFVLVSITTASILLVNRARDDNARVVHTVEVENLINTLLLDIRRAESAARGYLLTGGAEFLSDHEAAVSTILPSVGNLAKATSDNPRQVDNIGKLRAAVETRLDQFKREMEFVRQNQPEAAKALVREAAAGNTAGTVRQLAAAMSAEEANLFRLRTASADRSQWLAGIVTAAGSGLVIALAGISIFLVRRSSRARDAAEGLLRDSNLNLESTVDERTADLREANEEIQRFAYIVSHDLRSPLVNIMGFTSELEELRGDIFRRIATLARAETEAPTTPDNATNTAEPTLEGADKQLSQDFSEALGFIKSSIAKMDRLITAILNLTREGRREFQPVRIDTRELIEAIVSTVAHQAAEAEASIHIEPLPDIVSDRLAMEQIFSNLIDNA
ncbi:MAG: CHASE3 domain-containing protein, partial [Bradyrhizobium sp.]|nr:CHASE3 domain-containing protein [Bradyrhizobium sp.]